MMKLAELLHDYPVVRLSGDPGREITGLAFDSRKVEPGGLFFALPGSTADGHAFIPQAIARGASAIVCDPSFTGEPEGVALVLVENSRHALGQLASRWYGNPSGKLKLVGITGTNGKTTTATLLYHLIIKLGFGAGLISTIQNRVNQATLPATHTTPDPLSLNALLDQMVSEGCSFCFMEVSSHAVDQQRIAGLDFAGGIFTNLTHDHLDYHKTFEAYLKAKKSFFDLLSPEAFALVNRDDRNGEVMLQNTAAGRYTYSLRSMADFRGRVLENRIQGILMNIDGMEAWFRLPGLFNAYNLLCVYSAAALLGLDGQEALTALSSMDPVEGRFNCITSPSGITGIVDYAHTPDALKNVLDTIHEIREKDETLITVVGAGGNRDTTKRPVMGRIAARLSDRVILTSDNPRDEEPEAILAQMESGVDPSDKNKVLVIANRREAIRTACLMARPGDIILVAGKGHETYQEIRGVKHPFDDREVLNEMFQVQPV